MPIHSDDLRPNQWVLIEPLKDRLVTGTVHQGVPFYIQAISRPWLYGYYIWIPGHKMHLSLKEVITHRAEPSYVRAIQKDVATCISQSTTPEQRNQYSLPHWLKELT